MDATKRSIGQIFDPSIRLVVPLFQRPYVWQQHKNWEPLWDSIRERAERGLEGGAHRPHFLGAVVLDRLKTRTGDLDARQVIDGQQRLTTFQIALAAARDLCRALGDHRHADAFAKLTKNHTPLSDEHDDEFKVWPTNVDRRAYREVMTAGSCEEVRKRSNGKPDAKEEEPHNLIAEAYLFFYRTFADWLGEKDSENFGDRLRVLYQTIKGDMLVVVIDLDEDDDAQVIFETLNALGTPLLPADLVKNYLFQAAESRNDKIEDLYRRFWKPFDEPFWRTEVGQGRLKRPRIDQFLQHYLTLVKGDEVPATHLFAEFRDYASKNPAISPTDHLRELHTYGGVFEKFQTGFDKSSREGRFFDRLEQLETTTFFPLLLEVFKSAEHLCQLEIEAILTDLESFIIRRMVCGLTTKAYNRLVRSLIQKTRAERFSANAIREFLLSQDTDSTRWPTDKEFAHAWGHHLVYRRLTHGRVRVVLEALELALYTAKSEKISIQSKLTIEHVLPQEWADHWPLPKSAPPDAKERRNALIQTFGNLTLVTGKLNPSMSNSDWETKRKALSTHGALALNRQLCGLAVWDDAAIERRGAELLELAKTIWPRPTTAARPEAASEPLDLRGVQTIPELIDQSDHFAALSKRERKAINRVAAAAAQLFRFRTVAGAHPFAALGSEAEGLDLIARHPKLLKAVKHIYMEDGSVDRIGKFFSPGYASGLLYLMGCSRTDPTRYRGAGKPREDMLDWGLWGKACEFWTLLADPGSGELEPVRQALLVADVKPDGDRLTLAKERLTTVVRAWGCYVGGQKITTPALASPHPGGCPTVGGIDWGESPPDSTTAARAFVAGDVEKDGVS